MRFLLLLMSFWLAAAQAATQESADELSIAVDDQELNVTRFGATGARLVIWIMPGFGEPDRMITSAQQLAQAGVEVWMVDLAESLYLPRGPSTMRSIDGRYVAALIEAAHKQTGKTIALIGRSYSAIPVLRGVRDWQQSQQRAGATKAYVSGVLLFSPEMYATIPALGLDPIFEPIAQATNVPIMLFQAGKRGNRWQLDNLLSRLRSGGAQVFVKIMPGVTGLYYHEDSAPETLAMLQQMPNQIINSLRLLENIPTPLVALPLPKQAKAKGRGLDNALKPFQGNPEPPPIALINAQGKKLIRKDYRGKVTVMNFWASWCRPCVEEIPSLNNLRKAMAGRPFELISVNYAEDTEQITDFLKMVKVEFPVLLDTDGSESAKWNVLVFPSTFVIGPDGRIVYGLNGAIHWDSPEIVTQLKALLPKSK